MRENPTIVVSVVVVNWNRRQLLQACLDSLTRQEGVTLEVILVDNGSVDGSAEWAEKEYPEGGPLRLRVLRNSTNRGFCAANNQGIAAARGEFIALLNNDAEAEPGWAAALLRAFDGRPEVGMAASKVLVHEDPRRIDKAGHLIYPDGQNRGRGSGELDRGQYDTVEEALWPDGCAAMYRRAMLERIGGFDEDLFAYGDDAELGLRARIAGWKCLYMPEAVVRHHRGASLGKSSARRVMLIERNRVLLAVKLFPWSLLLLNPWYFLVRLAAGAWAAARGRGEVGAFAGPMGKLRAALGVVWGDLAALPMIPATLVKRRRIARIRKLAPAEVRRLILDNRIPLRTLMEQAA